MNEGDAFNAFKVKRSQDRIQNLGFFQENLEIKQTQGSSNDRVVLNVDVEEKSTGELQLSAGYSSLEKFILSASVAQRNFMGKGQHPADGHQLFALFEVDLGRLHRAVSVRQEHPARRRALLPRLQQLQLRPGWRPQPDLWPELGRRRRPAGFPGHRICQLRHALFADPGRYHARQGYVLRSDLVDPDGDGPLPDRRTVPCRPARGRPLSVPGARQEDHVVDRLYRRL